MTVRPRVVYTHSVPPEGAALLRDTCDVVEAPDDGSPSREEIVARARDADVLCYFVPDSIDRALLMRLPRLRVLAGFGKGYDNVDLAAARERGIVVTNVPLALTDSTADLAWALLLGVARRVAPGDAFVRDGNEPGWHARRFLGTRVSGSRLGIYGFGAIGRAIARRARGFAMQVAYFDRARAPLELEHELGARFCERDALLRRADYLVLAVPLTAQTRGAIGEPELRAMQPHAYIVNVARGSIVDESAVSRAIAAERLAGYASDVFAREDRLHHAPAGPLEAPPGSLDASLVRERERTLFTPHLGTAVAADRVELAIVQARCILQALRGESPEGRVV